MKSLLTPDGIPYGKKDGECAHPACTAFVDFFKHDKPPPGWATIVFNRYTPPNRKRRTPGGLASVTILVCPEHTISFVPRQLGLVARAKKLVRTIIESPFAGDVQKNLRYLRAAMRDCLLRGEAPYASHALYTQEGVLDDGKPEERALGMEAGFVWGEAGQKVAVYTDLGLSSGMQEGIRRAEERGQLVERRSLSEWVRRGEMHER